MHMTFARFVEYTFSSCDIQQTWVHGVCRSIPTCAQLHQQSPRTHLTAGLGNAVGNATPKGLVVV